MDKKKRSIIIIMASVVIIGIFAALTVTNTDSYKISKCLKTANTYLSNGDYDSAIVAYNALLDLDINSKDAYMGLVKANIGKGDYRESEKVVEMARTILGDGFTDEDDKLVHDIVVSSHEHNYEKATCTQSEVCSICGETGADALGHDFADADCVTPRTCSRCGETEGEPLGHDFEEATLWSAKVCKVCNATEGEPLPGIFEQYGLSYVDAVDAKVDGNLYDHNIPFTITMSDYSCFESDASHEAKDGYVWQQITMDVVMYLNADSWTYGHGYGKEDFYDPKLADDTGVEIKDGLKRYTANYMGNKYEDCLRGSKVLADNYYPAMDGVPGPSRAVEKVQFSFRVPKGYDGSVATFVFAPPTGEYIYDTAECVQMFRLPAANP